MKNLRISLKLIVSFLIVIVLAVIVGAVGITGMYQINAADDAMYEGNYLPTVMSEKISQGVMAQRIAMLKFAIYNVNDDATIFKNTENDLSNSQAEMKQLMEEYEPTIVNPEDRAAFNAFKELYNGDWSKLINDVHTMGVNNQMADIKVLIGKNATTANKLDELTTTLSEINMADGRTAVDDNTKLFMLLVMIEVAMLAVAVAVALFLALYISKLIVTPLKALTNFMIKAGATGDIVLTPEDIQEIGVFSKMKDETGQCIGSTASFIRHVTTIAEELGAIANGDLTVQVHTLSDKDVMGVAMVKMLDSLNNMFSEINQSTAQVATGSKQIADGAQSLAQGSTEQASAVEQLSSSIHEIADKTRTNSEMATKAANLAESIKGSAEKGSRQMDEMMSAVKEINQASQNISKVIKVIDDIAFQTNILALNAAVEAARAGQHGKGFAVVAEEVRSLAAKSAEAARDTSGLISSSVEKAELGARIAGETSASLVEIVSGISESSLLVMDIAKSSEEQSLGIEQINNGIDQVAQVVQQNSATAEESAAASEQMSGQAGILEELISQFKIKDAGKNRSFAPAAGQKRLAMPEKTNHSVPAGEYGKY